eukprot:m.118927 g.118927  ORF g.118927 m.118927 type:complete len:494 (-) comp52028_c0_seq2:6-1487(-)
MKALLSGIFLLSAGVAVVLVVASLRSSQLGPTELVVVELGPDTRPHSLAHIPVRDALISMANVAYNFDNKSFLANARLSLNELFLWHNGSAVSIPLRVLPPEEGILDCHQILSGPVLLVAIFIAKNFAEIIFQTLEAIFRALQVLPQEDREHLTLLMLGSRAYYDQPVFALAFELLASIISLDRLEFLDNLAAHGTVCFQKLHVLSQDVKFVYSFALPSPDPATQAYQAQAVPAQYQSVWINLAQAIRSRVLSPAASRPVSPLPTLEALAHSTLNLTFISRSRTNITHFGAHRDFARSILNMETLLHRLRKDFPRLRIQELVMESMALREQLVAISQTQILVCVHGAGCIHSMFLPVNAIFIQISPFMVEHDLYPRVALLTKHRAIEHQVKRIDQSVFYSHAFPSACLDALARELKAVAPTELAHFPPSLQFAATASNLTGVDGSTYARFSDMILQQKVECRLNSFYWKQQDLRLDVDAFSRTIVKALASPLV